MRSTPPPPTSPSSATAVATAAVSLDIPERQVLVPYYNNDLVWRHRVLLVKLGDARWVVGTPDFEVQAADLSTFRKIHALPRNGDFPASAIAAGLYCFDNPIRDEDLLQMRGEAARLAAEK